MKAEPRFLHQAKHFWANVRTVSEAAGYTDRKSGGVKILNPAEIAVALRRIGLGTAHVLDRTGAPTAFGKMLADYFAYRARLLNEFVEPRLELEDLREHEGIYVRHCLMVDSHYTWWNCGRSYLCRMIDMLHMRYVDEVLFGYEVIEQLPSIVREWVAVAREHSPSIRQAGPR